ncbi:MAG: DegV family protein [Ruminococcaceae bacterium]|nr:DegV family protein [Oscillospiraceae bacterium]
MSYDYILSCCTYTDFSAQKMKELDIRYICTPYMMDGKTYYDDLGETTSYADFYKAMENGAITSTSQLNQDEFAEYFRELLKEGKDIIHVSLSSGLSGVSNSARLAIETMKQEFPDRKIYLVDSLAAAAGLGLLMETASDLRAQGMGIEELYNWLEDNKLRLHHWFFTTDLTYFVRGGRVSKASGFIGGVLNICPLMNVSNQGKLIPRAKIRGKKKVFAEIVERMKKHADNGTQYSGKCFMCNSACEDDAKEVAAMIEAQFPNLDGKVQIFTIGTTIGSHTGPGTVAVFFWGDERVD